MINCQRDTLIIFCKYDTFLYRDLSLIKVSPPRLSQSLFFHGLWLKNHAFMVNKHSKARKVFRKLIWWSYLTWPSSHPCWWRVLTEENQDNVHESDVNESVKRTLNWLYLKFSYNSRTGCTSKSKVLRRKHSLRPSDI